MTGTEYYALQLIRALIVLNEQAHHHQIKLYFRDTPSPDLFPPLSYVEHQIIPFRRLWTHVRFAAALWRDRPDVMFVPAHTLPISFPGRGVVTVHDLGFRYFPEAHPIRDRWYLDWTTRYSAQRADLVLADSAATAYDLTHFYNILTDKTRVVYPGVQISPAADEAVVRAKTKYNLPERYFLFIGTLQPRKNIARIVQAYWLYRMTGGESGLVLAGGKGWLYDPAWVKGVEGISLTGYIDEADKAALYGGAVALVFPTLYEGFGFPVIEAMLCGTPVITSRTSSLPELAGNAAMLVNPLNVDEIAAALMQIDKDEELQSVLRQSGLIQAQQFTWERASRQTMAALEKAGNENGAH